MAPKVVVVVHIWPKWSSVGKYSGMLLFMKCAAISSVSPAHLCLVYRIINLPVLKHVMLDLILLQSVVGYKDHDFSEHVYRELLYCIYIYT